MNEVNLVVVSLSSSLFYYLGYSTHRSFLSKLLALTHWLLSSHNPLHPAKVLESAQRRYINPEVNPELLTTIGTPRVFTIYVEQCALDIQYVKKTSRLRQL